MSSWERGRTVTKPVLFDHFEIDDGIRVAVLGPCPYCHAPGHRHAIPFDVLPTAELTRMARCDNRRGSYYLVLDGAATHA